MLIKTPIFLAKLGAMIVAVFVSYQHLLAYLLLVSNSQSLFYFLIFSHLACFPSIVYPD